MSGVDQVTGKVREEKLYGLPTFFMEIRAALPDGVTPREKQDY